MSSEISMTDDFCVFIYSRSTNRTDRNGNTALHLCAELGRPETTKLLLRASAQWNLPNNASETAIDVAQRKGNSRCIELV